MSLFVTALAVAGCASTGPAVPPGAPTAPQETAGATPRPATTSSPVVTTDPVEPVPTTQPEEAGALELGDIVAIPRPSETGGGLVQVIAEVRNTGPVPVRVGGARWVIQLDGSPEDTGSLSAYPHELGPGESGYLLGERLFPSEEEFKAVRESSVDSLAYRPAPKEITEVTADNAELFSRPFDPPKYEVSDLTVQTIWPGTQVINGTIANVGGLILHTADIAVILFDATGRPAFFYWGTWEQRLEPGERTIFALENRDTDLVKALAKSGKFSMRGFAYDPFFW